MRNKFQETRLFPAEWDKCSLLPPPLSRTNQQTRLWVLSVPLPCIQEVRHAWEGPHAEETDRVLQALHNGQEAIGDSGSSQAREEFPIRWDSHFAA